MAIDFPHPGMLAGNMAHQTKPNDSDANVQYFNTETKYTEK